MRRRRVGLTLVAVLGALVAASNPTADAQQTQKAPAAELPTELPDIDMSGLSEEQKAGTIELLSRSDCNCSCGMTVARCRIDDPSCGRSVQLGNEVVALVRKGDTPAAAGKKVFGGGGAGEAPKEKVFDVQAGDSFYVGPEDAPVTLITWLDFQ